MIQFKFQVDIKTVRKCFAYLEQDIPSDEEIKSGFDNITVNLSEDTDKDMKQAELGLTMMAVGQYLEHIK